MALHGAYMKKAEAEKKAKRVKGARVKKVVETRYLVVTNRAPKKERKRTRRRRRRRK